MLNRIYIETSIPSFYFTERSSAEAIARKNWTRLSLLVDMTTVSCDDGGNHRVLYLVVEGSSNNCSNIPVSALSVEC